MVSDIKVADRSKKVSHILRSSLQLSGPWPLLPRKVSRVRLAYGGCILFHLGRIA
jgi:hypothetical protein